MRGTPICGRSPSLKEKLILNAAGIPTSWQIDSNTTFESQVSEQFDGVSRHTRSPRRSCVERS